MKCLEVPQMLTPEKVFTNVTAEFLAKQNGYQPYLDGRIEVTQ